MNPHETRRLSKFLSYVLRHDPQALGLEFSPEGWVSVEALLEAAGRRGRPLTREQLEEIVRTNDKQRFAFSEDGAMIRAHQGHSLPVELDYPPAEPPERLFHGTIDRFLAAIRKDGLQRRRRHHVHLSPDEQTASAVGARRGKPVILTIRAREMHDAGHNFYLTPNRVWLTEEVPPQYIEFP